MMVVFVMFRNKVNNVARLLRLPFPTIVNVLLVATSTDLCLAALLIGR